MTIENYIQNIMKAATKKPTQVTAEPNGLEVNMTREFEAPCEKVFRAFTDADLMLKWWGPRKMKMRFEKFEPRDGGSYRYFHTGPNGMEVGFHGVFHEVSAPERIIQTFEFEGLPERGHVCLETIRFEALPGNRTRVHYQDIFQSAQDRQGAIDSGMTTGVDDMHERLDELIEAGQL
jgi:uncharacterized protein YndB with AHSA1/START domain